MREIKIEEMKKVEGGMSEIAIAGIVTGVITFVIGVLSGYSNPVKCNN